MDQEKSIPDPVKPKSFDWLELLKAVALPLVLGVLGLYINVSLNERQSEESNVRLYADMMARREQADSDLRKDMFKSILDKFVSTIPDSKSAEYLDQQIVNLELAAYNFNESINLGPLFKHLRSEIPDSPTPGRPREEFKRFQDLLHRLEKVAVEVDERQLTVVQDSGAGVRAGADGLSQISTAPAYLRFLGPSAVPKKDLKPEDNVPYACLTLAVNDKDKIHNRRFKLEVIDYDAGAREIQVRLYASRPISKSDCTNNDPQIMAQQEKAQQEIDVRFWVGLFALPMIDNTRLSHSERLSVSLTSLTPDHAEIALAYFPSSRASLKDKPYYDELEHDLLHKETDQTQDKR